MWKLFLPSLLFLTGGLGAPQIPTARIIGGENATIDDYPYAVQIEYYYLVCGGVLVSPQWVLTAGICLYDKDVEVFVIRIGSTERGVGGETFNITQVVYHPNFSWDQNEYNALLLRINGTVTDESRLVEMVEAESPIPVGANMTVIGWGAVNEDYLDYDENLATVLQEVVLPILDDETCVKADSQFQVITESMFCAGYLEGGKGFCWSDNGGAALYQGQLIALASWTNNCARAGIPGVFTKISLIRTWVDSVIST